MHGAALSLFAIVLFLSAAAYIYQHIALRATDIGLKRSFNAFASKVGMLTTRSSQRMQKSLVNFS